jgi:hypothetical protein
VANIDHFPADEYPVSGTHTPMSSHRAPVVESILRYLVASATKESMMGSVFEIMKQAFERVVPAQDGRTDLSPLMFVRAFGLFAGKDKIICK